VCITAAFAKKADIDRHQVCCFRKQSCGPAFKTHTKWSELDKQTQHQANYCNVSRNLDGDKTRCHLIDEKNERDQQANLRMEAGNLVKQNISSTFSQIPIKNSGRV
jgi:hypothetical protein